jgi:hypothetical protein
MVFKLGLPEVHFKFNSVCHVGYVSKHWSDYIVRSCTSAECPSFNEDPGRKAIVNVSSIQ